MRISLILLALILVLGKSPTPSRGPAPTPAEAIWQIRLPEPIRIGLDHQPVVRTVSLGSTEIPLEGFEPGRPLDALDLDPAAREILGPDDE